MWSSRSPQGAEAAKIQFELVPYMHGVVLDLGCGPQKVFPHLKNVIGVDNDIDAKLFGIRANPNIYADATKSLPFCDEYADTVFSSHLLEHAEDYKAALAEWWRVLKPGGHLILYVPHADWYPNVGMPNANPDHKHDLRNADVTHAMKEVAWRSGRGWEQIRDEVRSGGNEYSFLQIFRKSNKPATVEYREPEKPEKTLGLVRLGAHGDALWVSAVLPYLKEQGYHITLYTQRQGEAALRHDPHIDRIICQPDEIFGNALDAGMVQSAYWLHEEKKYDRFINLVGVVERGTLAHLTDFAFYFSKEQRDRLMNRNYMEAVFEWCGVPFDPNHRVRFYPSPEEWEWAANYAGELDGPLVLINPAGSTWPKFWPHAERLMELLDAQGINSVLVGDLRGKRYKAPPRGRVLGMDVDIRKVFTLARFAAVVVGTESAIVNSVSHEECAKIVFLSHSSEENLTKYWKNTVSFSPVALPCYPCHRIHMTPDYCTLTKSGNAACQEAATPELVAQACVQWINGALKEAA